MMNVFGQLDSHIKKIETDFDVTIIDRDGSIKIVGERGGVLKAKSILEQLLAMNERGNEIEEQNVDYAITLGKDGEEGT